MIEVYSNIKHLVISTLGHGEKLPRVQDLADRCCNGRVQLPCLFLSFALFPLSIHTKGDFTLYPFVHAISRFSYV